MTINISPDLIFNPEEYLIINPDISHLSNEESVRHFFCVGIAQMRKFSKEVFFDPRFYQEYYSELCLLSDEASYEHWIRIGCNEGLHPNGTSLIKSMGFKIDKFPNDFFVEAYAQAAGIKSANKWLCLEHFIKEGFSNVDLLNAAKAGPELLKQIGESCAHLDSNKSIKYLELASIQEGAGPEVFHSLGDINLNLGNYFGARLAYKEALARNSDYFWTLANLAVSCEKLGLYNEAILYAGQACKMHNLFYFSRNNLDNYAKKKFYSDLNAATSLSVNLRDIEASDLSKKAINSYYIDSKLNDRQQVKKLLCPGKDFRIAIFGSDYIFQCKLYRIDQKIEQLKAIGQTIDYYPLSNSEGILNKLFLYDVLIVYRAPSTPDVMRVLAMARAYKVVSFYDIDDLIFDSECYPPSRRSLEGMVTAEEYAGLVTGREMFRTAIEFCDFGIASTPLIQSEMEKLVRERKCFLHRNGLGNEHTKFSCDQSITSTSSRPKKEVIFFYGSGSKSHNENFDIISESLSRVLRENESYKLIVYGPLDLQENFDGLENQITRLEFSDNISEYWEILESSDINLAPLVNSKFNDGKSEIKWMEAGMLGVPSIVSSTAVYRKVINNKIDGLIVDNKNDWYEALNSLAASPELRQIIGNAARQHVHSNYNLKKMGTELLSFLNRNYLLEEVSKKKRILIVNVFYPPQFIGGATRIVEQSTSFINKNYLDEFEVEVFCARDSGGSEGSFERYDWNGVSVNSLSPFDDRDATEHSFKTECLFGEFVDRFKPDLIHFHCVQRLTASVIDVARQKSIPYIVTVHDGWWISDRQFLIDENGVPVYTSGNWGDRKRLSRLSNSLNHAKLVLAVSHSFADLYRSRGIRNVNVCLNGAEIIENVSPQPNSGPIWLGLLGGLGLAKGANLLYDALCLRKFSNLRFLIVDHAALEGTSREEYWGENKVKIIGKTNFRNVADIYSKLHFVLAISICVESFGLVAREASLLGRWVIASDRGGIGEDIENNVNGFVIDVSSPGPLIETLDKIESNFERYYLPPVKGAFYRTTDDNSNDIAEFYRQALS